MNQQQILDVAKRSGVLISGRDEFLKAVTQFGRLLINKAAPRPLTKTQRAYLAALDDWQSLQELANKFDCTPQNALKMVRVLQANRLISKTKLFKRRTNKGAWAFYYRRNCE
jgi:DNA-binding MarR family transcriptional regulator